MSFKNVKTAEILSNLISVEGDYTLQVMNVAMIDSFTKNFSGDQKDYSELIKAGKHWADPVDQIAITFGDVTNADRSKNKGVITHRLSEKGFVHVDDEDFNDSVLEQKGVKVIEGVVCKKNAKDNLYYRVVSAKKEATCDRMYKEFMFKLGVPVDLDHEEALAHILENKCRIGARIRIDEFNGKRNAKIDASWKVRETADAESVVNASDFEE